MQHRRTLSPTFLPVHSSALSPMKRASVHQHRQGQETPSQPARVGLDYFKAQPLKYNLAKGVGKGTLLKQVGKNFTQSLAQDTGFFKIASAPVASGLLVVARAGVSLNSVKQAREQQRPKHEQNYIKEQALMTITREFAGLLLSYGLMSALNITLDNTVQVATGMRVDKPDVTGPLKALNQSIQIITGTRKQVNKAPEALGNTEDTKASLSTNALQRGLRKGLAWAAFTSDKSLDALEHQKRGLSNLRNFGIPLFSTGVSVILAGWVLERTTLLHSNDIMAYLHERRGRKRTSRRTPAQGSPSPAVKHAMSPSLQTAPTLAG
jgi:hypothetical protein